MLDVGSHCFMTEARLDGPVDEEHLSATRLHLLGTRLSIPAVVGWRALCSAMRLPGY